MADMSASDRRALFYFGAVERATNAGMNTSEIWQAVRDQAAAAGLESHGLGIQDVNRLRSQAVSIRNATERLSSADPRAPIEGNMIGTAPWARPVTEQSAISRWQARFEHTFIENGVQNTAWRTVVFTGTLPGSVDEFNQAIYGDALNMADSYSVGHVGVGNVSLLAI